MKSLISILLSLFVVSAFGQVPPPVLRTPWTTNNPPSTPSVSGSISILNGDLISSLTMLNANGLLTNVLLGNGFSLSGNSLTVPLGNGLEFDGAAIGISKTPTTVLAGTNNAVVTNITIVATSAFTSVVATNNMTTTNLTGASSGVFNNALVLFRPQLVNRTNCYPIGNQYGQAWKTNVNAPLFTTLTSGVFYVLSLTTVDSNVLASMSVWQP